MKLIKKIICILFIVIIFICTNYAYAESIDTLPDFFPDISSIEPYANCDISHIYPYGTYGHQDAIHSWALNRSSSIWYKNDLKSTGGNSASDVWTIRFFGQISGYVKNKANIISMYNSFGSKFNSGGIFNAQISDLPSEWIGSETTQEDLTQYQDAYTESTDITYLSSGFYPKYDGTAVNNGNCIYVDFAGVHNGNLSQAVDLSIYVYLSGVGEAPTFDDVLNAIKDGRPIDHLAVLDGGVREVYQDEDGTYKTVDGKLPEPEVPKDNYKIGAIVVVGGVTFILMLVGGAVMWVKVVKHKEYKQDNPGYVNNPLVKGTPYTQGQLDKMAKDAKEKNIEDINKALENKVIKEQIKQAQLEQNKKLGIEKEEYLEEVKGYTPFVKEKTGTFSNTIYRRETGIGGGLVEETTEFSYVDTFGKDGRLIEHKITNLKTNEVTTYNANGNITSGRDQLTSKY